MFNLCFKTYKDIKAMNEFETQKPLSASAKELSKTRRILNHDLGKLLLKL